MFEESASPKLPFHQCLPRAQSPFSTSEGEGGRYAG
jgi:hypothetical protein